LCRYINTFGVYQDFYVREYLTNYTPSEIGYNVSIISLFELFFIVVRRWIGGVQVFLNLFLGAITGRLFDKGYLYVSPGSAFLGYNLI